MSRDRQSGATLVEILVGLAVVAVMSGAAMIALGAADRTIRSEQEAERLTGRLRAASDAAILSGSPATLAWDEYGYAFQGTAPGAGTRHDLPGALRLSAIPRQGAIMIAPDGSGGGMVWRISTGSAGWRVTFDGLAAVHSRIGD